jgi:CRP/FNR family transcriptional regulator, cyclic AMP receptor protein
MSSFFAYPPEDAPPTALRFLAGRPDEDWTRIARHGDRIRFAVGGVVVREGHRDRALYVVLSGRLEARVKPPARIEAGSVFGEVAFLDGLPRSATVVAVESGEALRLSYDAFAKLAARHPELGRSILLELGRIVSARLRRAAESAS